MIAGPSASTALHIQPHLLAQHGAAGSVGKEANDLKSLSIKPGAACARNTPGPHALEVLMQPSHGGFSIVRVNLQCCIHAHSKALQAVKRCMEVDRHIVYDRQAEVYGKVMHGHIGI